MLLCYCCSAVGNAASEGRPTGMPFARHYKDRNGDRCGERLYYVFSYQLLTRAPSMNWFRYQYIQVDDGAWSVAGGRPADYGLVPLIHGDGWPGRLVLLPGATWCYMVLVSHIARLAVLDVIFYPTLLESYSRTGNSCKSLNNHQRISPI